MFIKIVTKFYKLSQIFIPSDECLKSKRNTYVYIFIATKQFFSNYGYIWDVRKKTWFLLQKCHFMWKNSEVFIKRMSFEGFPGGAVVETLPANSGDTGSSPGVGRSHMLWSNWVCEPQLLSLRVWSLCSATREAAIVRGPCTAMKSGPCLPQLETALAQKRRPNTAKNKN